MSLPWSPLYTLERSEMPEVTAYGVLCVTTGGGSNAPLLSVGDADFPIWSRSLLKPWQLLSLMPTLKSSYPALKPHHYAVMLASPNGEPQQLQALQEIMEMGQLTVEDLQCPACYPLSSEQQTRLKAEGKPKSPFYHPCCGKHLATLLALKAMNEDLATYLEPETPLYKRLKRFLALLLWRANDDFPVSVDGCGMPNYALTSEELAVLFCQLAQQQSQCDFEVTFSDLIPSLKAYPEIKEIIMQQPQYVGGSGRLDTALINRELTLEGLDLVAKEGADGLLGVGISPSARYPEGVGILLKLAAGYDSAMMKVVIIQVLKQLALLNPACLSESETDVVNTRFHFLLSLRQEV
jgi:L-asparaginase